MNLLYDTEYILRVLGILTYAIPGQVGIVHCGLRLWVVDIYYSKSQFVSSNTKLLAILLNRLCYD